MRARLLIPALLLCLGSASASSGGTWYVKFISMTHVTEAKLDYVSQWATLTFAVPRRPARKAQ